MGGWGLRWCPCRRRYEGCAPVAPLKWPGSIPGSRAMSGWCVLNECSRQGGPVFNCPGPPLAGFSSWICCISRGRGNLPRPTTPAPADQCRRPPDQDGKDDAEGEEQDRPVDDVMTAIEVDVIGGVTDHLGRRCA